MTIDQDSEAKPVLDFGYVRLVDHMGSDLSVVNAARASFAKESRMLVEADRKLLKFLWDRKETSPFRHAAMTFELSAPLMVCRQWWKYVVASSHVDDQIAHNETSRRYVNDNLHFYVPTEWRAAPDHKKQGSGGALPAEQSFALANQLAEFIIAGWALYEEAIHKGAAPEMARLFLPAYGLYTTWRWTVSLAAVLHFLEERLAEKAQSEMRLYAVAVRELITPLFPATMEIVFG